MTIAEIESTLHTLRTRHQNLDEQLLITLLTAGGWEEKVVKDAVSIFRNSVSNNNTTAKKAVDVVLPSVVVSNPVATTPLPVNISNQKIEVKEIVNKPAQVVPKNETVAPIIPVIPVTPVAPVKPVVTVAPVIASSEITYYNPDGEEENVTQPFPEITKEIPRKEKITLQAVLATPPPKIKEEHIIVHEIPKKVEPTVKEIKVKPVEVIPVVEKKEAPKITPTQEIKKEKAPVPQEPQSLILPTQEQRQLPSEIVPPENLPLKPFDSTPHIWPFSKYKEVFHGEIMPPLHPEERELVNSQTNSQIAVPEEHKIKRIKLRRSGFDGEDEGLIFLTGTTLLIILLLLAYMYSNGRF